MGLGIPPLRIKIVLESNPLKSAMLVGGLGVQHCTLHFTWLPYSALSAYSVKQVSPFRAFKNSPEEPRIYFRGGQNMASMYLCGRSGGQQGARALHLHRISSYNMLYCIQNMQVAMQNIQVARTSNPEHGKLLRYQYCSYYCYHCYHCYISIIQYAPSRVPPPRSYYCYQYNVLNITGINRYYQVLARY